MKKLLAVLLTLAMMFALVACGGNTSTTDNGGNSGNTATDNGGESDGGETGGWRIAFSNSYVGNAWRTAAVNIFDAYTADLVEQGVIAEAYSSSAGQDVQAQINEIRNMMSEGYDAIVVIAATETGLTSVLEEAAERGIDFGCFHANGDSALV